MRKICFFNSSNFWGGGEKLHLENAKAFRQKGYEVTLAAHKGSDLWNRAQAEGFQTFDVEVGSLSFLDVLKLSRIASYFKKENIDTVIFTTSQDLKTASLAAKWAKCSKIVYLRGLAVPIKNSWINRFCLGKACTHLIANSQETKRTMLKNLASSIPAENIDVVYHGIDLGKRNNNNLRHPSIPKEENTIILGNAGRLTTQKGQLDLIQVMKSLKESNLNCKLYIAGTGELEPELRQEIEKNQLQESIIPLGFVADMDAFMRSIDVFLLTSSWEGFGFVLVEAMYYEKPVVAYDITSNPEILEAEKTGLLAEYHNVDDFASNTKKLVQDEELRRSMGMAGKKRVQEHFDIKERIDHLEKVILENKH